MKRKSERVTKKVTSQIELWTCRPKHDGSCLDKKKQARTWWCYRKKKVLEWVYTIFSCSFQQKGNLSICIMMLAPSIVWLDGSAYYISSKKEVNEIRKHRSTKASSLSCDKSQIFSNEKNMIQFWYLHKLVIK